MRVGSLCTGIAGLELGLELAGVDVDTRFVADIDPGSKVWLEKNMPSTPNLGDFTQIDPSDIPEVDLITAGFPCQPVSTAGLMKGVHDERWLFDSITHLASRMESRPRLFLENVSGLLTANDRHAFSRIVHGLAEIGYSLTWGTLPAAAVGAPHRRLRWWGLAWYTAGSPSEPLPKEGSPRRAAGKPDSEAAADTDDGPQPRCAEPEGRAIAADASNPAPDADHDGRQVRNPERLHDGVGASHAARSSGVDFGEYGPAISRWESVLGRAAPHPLEEGRLSPAFTEWLMGYPAGWVTDTLTDRRQALFALGNAVVPQAAAAAFTQLTQRMEQP